MKTLSDELLAHQIATVKHGQQLGQLVMPYMTDIKAIVRNMVAEMDSQPRTAKRLNAEINKLAKRLAIPASEWQEELIAALKEFTKYELEFQANTMEEWLEIDFVRPSMQQVWAAIEFNPLSLGKSPMDFPKLIDDWGKEEVDRLVLGVKDGFIRGLTAKQIVRDVVGAGGLADVSQRNALSIAQTAIAHVANEARQAVYEANDEVVIGYQIVATLDSRTSETCRFYDGMKVKNTDTKKPQPPFHHRCRTSTKPLLSDEFDFLDKGATRASAGGQVDAKTTYYAWLADQPKALQDQVLGPVRGELFRKSGLSPEEFRRATVDDLARPITLEEMAKRDKKLASLLDDM